MSLQKIDGQYLRPPRFDAETLDTRVLEEWEHWRKCFENFIVSINNNCNHPYSNINVQYLINHLSPRVYNHVKHLTTSETGYHNAIAHLDNMIRYREPVATAAATSVKNKTKPVPQEHYLNDITKLTKKLFEEAKLGKLDTINKINTLKDDNMIREAHDHRHKTLLQVAIVNGHEEFARELLNIISRSNVDKQSLVKHVQHKTEFITAGETFIHNSLPELVDFRKKPQSQNRAVFAILYAHNFITEYKKYLSGKIIDADVIIVDALLEALEFDKRCAKFATLDQGRGLLYYELTDGPKEKDVNFFVDLFECNAIAPVKRFIKSLKKL